MRWLLVFLLAWTGVAGAQLNSPGTLLPKDLRDIGIQQELGHQIPLDIPFRDEYGNTVPLSSFFGKRPVLLIPVYYTCPMLCSQILSGVVAGMRPMSLKPGKDFEVVAFSFNPSETPADAMQKRNYYVHSYGSHASPAGWHFLTGSQQSITALTDAIGFHYKYDPASKMFLHASGVMILTPEGRLSRYFYGVEYDPNDLRLGVIESSKNHITTPVEQVLLFCYHYDPTTGKYGATVMNLLHAAGVLTILAMGVGFFLVWRYDKRRYHAQVRKGDA